MNRLESLCLADASSGRGPVMEARGLTRYFGSRCAVDSVSFGVPRRCVFGFIGRNGAGKSTTIRMMLSLLEPTRVHKSLLKNTLGDAP